MSYMSMGELGAEAGTVRGTKVGDWTADHQVSTGEWVDTSGKTVLGRQIEQPASVFSSSAVSAQGRMWQEQANAEAACEAKGGSYDGSVNTCTVPPKTSLVPPKTSLFEDLGSVFRAFLPGPPPPPRYEPTPKKSGMPGWVAPVAIGGTLLVFLMAVLGGSRRRAANPFVRFHWRSPSRRQLAAQRRRYMVLG